MGSAGTLAGYGTVHGSVLNHGIVSPGNSLGTLTIGGNYSGSGTIEIELDGTKGHGVTSDQLKVLGNANLTGGTLLLVKSPYELACGDQALVINAGSYTGQLDLFDISGFDDLMLFDNGTGIVYGVGVQQGENLSAIPGLNSNQKAMANALSNAVLTPDNFIDHTDPLGSAVLAVIEDCDDAGKTLNLLSPESYAGFTDYGMHVTRNYTRTAMGMPGPSAITPQAPPMVDAKGGMEDAKGGMGSKGGLIAPPATTVGSSTSVFAGYSHYDGSSDSSNDGADYDLNSNGAFIGLRHDTNRLMFGGFVGFDNGDVTSSTLNANVDGFIIGGFVRYLANEQHNILIDGGLTYGQFSFDGNRDSLGGRANFNNVDSNVFDLFASVQGDVYNKNKLRLSPMLSLHYITSDVDSFTESGSGTALRVGSMNEEALPAEISLNARYDATDRLALLGNIGYTHNFMDSDRGVNARFVNGGTPFSVYSPGMGQDFFSIGAGVVWNVTDNLHIGANYRAEFGNDSGVSNSVGVGASYTF